MTPLIGKLIFVGIFVAISVISAVYRKYQEQAAKRRQQELAERAELDRLRMGPRPGDSEQPPMVVMMSPPPSAAPGPLSPREQLKELAERRNRQLQELRRRMQQRGGAPPGPAPQRPQAQPQPVRQSQRPEPEIPRGERADYEDERRREAQAKRRAARQRAETQRAAAPPPMPQKATRPAARAVDTPTYRSGQDTGAGSPARAAAGIFGGQRLSAADWRKVIAMREVFGPPVSMRDPEDEGTAA